MKTTTPMSTTAQLAVAITLALVATGCGDEFPRENTATADTSAQTDGSLDSGESMDTTHGDAGEAPDGGGGTADSGAGEDTADTASEDAGGIDGVDGGGADVSLNDAGGDAGVPDAGVPDAGDDDASDDDAGEGDTGGADAAGGDTVGDGGLSDVPGGDASGDASGDAGTGDTGGDAVDAGCAATAVEVCDGVDNDCDGQTDNVSCDDGNDCTTDVCDAKAAACTHVPVAAGVACDDGNACTQGESCLAGACVGKPAPDGAVCGSPTTACTVGDLCKAGACVPGAAKPDGAACSDGDPCSSDDACVSGACKATVSPSVCDDGSACTVGACVAVDTNTATCVFKPANEGKPCSDGNACTTGDACTAGVCKAAKDLCTYLDVLDEKVGCVVPKGWELQPGVKEPAVAWHMDATPAKPGYKSPACSLNVNNGVNTQAGKRVVASATTPPIPIGQVAHAAVKLWTYNGVRPKPGVDVRQIQVSADNFTKKIERFYLNNLEAAGVWQQLELPLGGWVGKTVRIRFVYDSIDTVGASGPGWFIDDVVLTEGSLPKACKVAGDCEDGDICTVGTCDGFTGTCKQTAVTDGTTCQDGDNCTFTGTCKAGSCEAAWRCDDGVECTKNLCNAFNGDCVFPPTGVTEVCDDGDACTTGTLCDAKGECSGGQIKSCDDSSTCTADLCDGALGCLFLPGASTACDDGDACTTGDSCDAKGACLPGAATPCDDGDSCTLDACDPKTGACMSTPIAGCGSGCKDDADCADGNSCTVDVCKGTCTHLPAQNGLVCGASQVCASGVCAAAPGGWATSIQSSPEAEFFCAQRGNGAVACWGRNDRGQLGAPVGPGYSATPTDIAGLGDATSVGLGARHACAVHGGGKVSCWGDNGSAQLGSPASKSPQPTPTVVSGLPAAVTVTAGAQHTCALSGAGDVWCWGSGANGRLGNGGTANSAKPVKVIGISAAVGVAAGAAHTCAWDTKGALSCWGANASQQSSAKGGKHLSGVLVATAYSGAPTVVSAAAGVQYTCMAGLGGAARCVGRNLFGNFGDGKVSATGTKKPVVVLSAQPLVSVAAGWTHSAGVSPSGSLLTWGTNSYGQLGDGTKTVRLTPIVAKGAGAVVQVAVGRRATCALRVDGSVACVGHNTWGTLGRGTAGAHSGAWAPVKP